MGRRWDKVGDGGWNEIGDGDEVRNEGMGWGTRLRMGMGDGDGGVGAGMVLHCSKCSLVLSIPGVTRDHFQGESMVLSLYTAQATL